MLQARLRYTKTLHKWAAERARSVPETLGIIRRICYVGKKGELLPLASTDALIEELVGPKRCLSANLAVVGDLASLLLHMMALCCHTCWQSLRWAPPSSLPLRGASPVVTPRTCQQRV